MEIIITMISVFFDDMAEVYRRNFLTYDSQIKMIYVLSCLAPKTFSPTTKMQFTKAPKLWKKYSMYENR